MDNHSWYSNIGPQNLTGGEKITVEVILRIIQ